MWQIKKKEKRIFVIWIRRLLGTAYNFKTICRQIIRRNRLKAEMTRPCVRYRPAETWRHDEIQTTDGMTSHRAARPTRKTDGISRRTLNDGQKDDDDEKEESDVEHYSVHLVVVAVGRFDLVSDTTAGSHALVQVEHETLKHGREKSHDYRISNNNNNHNNYYNHFGPTVRLGFSDTRLLAAYCPHWHLFCRKFGTAKMLTIILLCSNF